MTAQAPPSRPNPRRATAFQRFLLIVLSPLVFLVLCEGLIRVSGMPTDLARNKNFKVAVPTWLLADNGWVREQNRRMENGRGVRAEDVAWFGYFEEARYVGIKLRPNLDVKVVNPFNDIEVAKQATFRITSNSDGFRGRDVGKKSPAVLRVAAIGDSSTFGWGVDPEYTYQELLAKRLSSGLRKAEVLNFGMPGTGSRHGVAVFKHYVAPLSPDVLIVSFGANDARYTPVSAEQELAADDTWLGAARWTMLKFQTFRLARKLIFSFYDPFKAVKQESAASAGQPAAKAAAAAEQRPMGKAVPLPNYDRNLRDIRWMARGVGAKTVFMSVCTPDEYVAQMHQTAQKLGVPIVDAGEIFRAKIDDIIAGKIYPAELAFYRNLYGDEAMKENWRLYITTDGCHPNRLGQSLIADALAEAVQGVLGR